MKLSTWHVISPETSIEDCLAALIKNMEILRAEQAKNIRRLQEDITKRIEIERSEFRRLSSAIEDISIRLETLGVGTLHLEWVGIFLLILGVVLATTPSEIVVALKRFL